MVNRRLLVLERQQELLSTFQSGLSSRIAHTNGNAALVVSQERFFEVQYVASPEEAVQCVQKSVTEKLPYAAVFFDFEFGPGTKAGSVLTQVKNLDPHLLVILVTAQSDDIWEPVHRVFGDESADRWDFVTKPFTTAQLLQKAQRAISSWDRRKREREYIERIHQDEAQLISAERLATVGTLARGIGQDFGNLLQQMMVKAEIALQKKNPADLEEALKYIIAVGDRASSVVRNLQSLVKTETGREALNLEVPIKEAVQLIEFEMKKSKVKFVPEYDKHPLPIIKMNKFEVSQVFLNLMVNSVHAMDPKGGELRVKTTTDEKGVSVAISDTGCGIPAENLQKIWEPLFTTKAGKGSGIGLSVTKKIIENHGGKIELASEVGKGTTFTLWFPRN